MSCVFFLVIIAVAGKRKVVGGFGKSHRRRTLRTYGPNISLPYAACILVIVSLSYYTVLIRLN